MARIGLVDAGVRDGRTIVLEHRARIVVDGGRHDVDAPPRPVERRGGEVRREGRHPAQVLGRGDDVQRGVLGDGREAPLLDEGPRAGHDVPILGERLVEGRGMVALDPFQHLVLRRAWVELGCRDAPGLVVEPELLPPDVQDLVGREAVERPQPDELVEPFTTQREPRARPRQLAADPAGVVFEGGLGGSRSTLQPSKAAAIRPVRDARGIRDEAQEVR